MLEMIFIDQTYEHAGGIKGGRVVPAALPYTLMEGLLCQTVQQMTGLALLEIEKKVLKPTFVGDTVHIEVEVARHQADQQGQPCGRHHQERYRQPEGRDRHHLQGRAHDGGTDLVHSRRARSAPVRELVH